MEQVEVSVANLLVIMTTMDLPEFNIAFCSGANFTNLVFLRLDLRLISTASQSYTVIKYMLV